MVAVVMPRVAVGGVIVVLGVVFGMRVIGVIVRGM